MIYINDNKYLNLPEQVQQNVEDITALAAAQDDDHDAINTNTNDINTLKGQITSVESITLKGDETNNKAQLYRSNKADMGSIQFKTVNGVSLIGEGDITMGTLSKYVMTSGDQTIAGVKTFSDPIHSNQLANEDGGALVRYKDTENASVFGGVNSKAVVMGSGDRPSYSKDGADFGGKDIALVEDVNNKVIDGDHIADGAVGIDQLGSQVVTTEKVALSAINTPQLHDNAVSTAKVLDNSITEAKLNSTYVDKVNTAIDTKQDKLVSGTNIKTINNESMLGSGNISLCTQSHWNLLMDNLGIGRWADQTLYTQYNWTNVIYDDLMPQYTTYARTFANSKFSSFEADTGYISDTNFKCQFVSPQDGKKSFMGTFYNTTFNKGIIIDLQNQDIFMGDSEYTFMLTNADSITFNNGTAFMGNMFMTFNNCPNLKSIDGIDFTYQNFLYNGNIKSFKDSTKLKHLGIKHIHLSMNISYSTAYEEADLVEIISNLDPVATTQTLTIGATNLAKLTNEEILVATGKGWQLA